MTVLSMIDNIKLKETITKKLILPCMTGFFSLWYYFANVLADRRGYAPAKRLGEAIVFVVFFVYLLWSSVITFLLAIFLLSPQPTCPLAPTLLLQDHSESAIRAAA